VERGLAALLEGDLEVLADCVDKNFALRASLYPISPRDREMVSGVRACGAAAKFCGSGGAVLAVARPGVDFAGLAATARESGWDMVLPQVEPGA
jgi:glucuronokinase